MTLTVNGEVREVPAGLCVSALLSHLGLVKGRVAVEVNLALVPRERHADYLLAEGDRVEIVTFVGGG